MWICRSRCMTLLEVLIGMGLTVLLLTTLSYFFQEMERLNSVVENRQMRDFQMRYLENRLFHVLPNALAENDPHQDFHFFTSNDANGLLAPNQPSLIFVYDSGADFDCNTAEYALGRLYLDQQQHLCLASWPTPDRWTEKVSARKEVLLEDVEGLSFEFFLAPEKESREALAKIVNKKDKSMTSTVTNAPEQQAEKEQNKEKSDEALEPVSRPASWVSQWPREYGHLPAMMKLRIKRKNSIQPSEITLAFPLPKSTKLIVYDQ